MTRWWNEFVAVLGDATPGGVAWLALSLILLATGAAVLWYTWPPRLAFLGRQRDGERSGTWQWRWPRLHWPRLRWRFRWGLGWLRWRWRRRRRVPAALAPDEFAADELPDLPAATLADTADQLAAAGRYAEAVRERLRAIVRGLIERDVIEHHPGWTVTELARAAAHARRETTEPLYAATATFSEIWYGQRPATLGDDARMRQYATAVHDALAERVGAAEAPR
ncbi:MAG TPA: DUF4129 domain-containing protein [Micromonosporaceae bacterium]|nr:DUF4129 domain-containing protein [Micromonosporaceae bacterium]